MSYNELMSDRKYRQRGYQDDPRDRERQGPRGPKPAPAPRAPGRQLQDAAGPKTPNLMASHEVFRCARCGNRLAVPVETGCAVLAMRRRYSQLHQLHVVRHQRTVGVHADTGRANFAEGRTKRLHVVRAANHC